MPKAWRNLIHTSLVAHDSPDHIFEWCSPHANSAWGWEQCECWLNWPKDCLSLVCGLNFCMLQHFLLSLTFSLFTIGLVIEVPSWIFSLCGYLLDDFALIKFTRLVSSSEVTFPAVVFLFLVTILLRISMLFWLCLCQPISTYVHTGVCGMMTFWRRNIHS